MAPRPLHFAGFWKRLFALIIDYSIVSFALFPFIVIAAIVFPSTVVVTVPWSLFTTERVIETHHAREKESDGSVTTIEVRFIETSIFGKWRYLYREQATHEGNHDDTERHLIDPVTREEISPNSLSKVTIWVLLFYWSIMEASVCQASLGKMMIGVRVTDYEGRRVSFTRSLVRNAAKILSCVTLFIGFAMAGWTKRKQGLHDYISSSYVPIGMTEEMSSDSARRVIRVGATVALVLFLAGAAVAALVPDRFTMSPLSPSGQAAAPAATANAPAAPSGRSAP